MVTPTAQIWQEAATFLIGYILVASAAYLLGAGLVHLVKRTISKPKRMNPGLSQLFK